MAGNVCSSERFEVQAGVQSRKVCITEMCVVQEFMQYRNFCHRG